MPTPRNLFNLKEVGKGFGSRTILNEVTLGVTAGERIGVVGENGGGKSTLLKLIAGIEQPDAGTLTRTGDMGVALLGQQDELDRDATIREVLVGERADHEWAGDRAFRDVLDGLLGGVTLERFPTGMDTPVARMSGGERRRIALARLLLEPPELLLLDEPTNHMDVEGVDWLARHLAARRGAMLVVTHDRWFLDAVCTATWEVDNGAVHQYEGGYAAYVLARTERDRQAAAKAGRREQLLRKELAWLRRGPPARTTKPKFRIEAAEALIADEPQARDRVELARFASARLGNKVVDAVNVSLTLGEREILKNVTWQLGPGDRVALVGINGSGKTSLIRLLAGELEPTKGRVERGETVKLAHLSQGATEIPGNLRVLESLEEVRSHAVLSDGRELTASLLCDRFGFRGPKARTLVADLSGGERRRLGLMRLLMGGPNVLLLDEPTNDLDIDTLTSFEDLLDSWPGTLVVVSHDRYFVERVCDNVYAIDGVGVRHVPGGIEQYLRERESGAQTTAGDRPAKAGKGQAKAVDRSEAANGRTGEVQAETTGMLSPGAATRAARKEARGREIDARRMERAIEKLAGEEASLETEMTASATDHGRLGELQVELERLVNERERLEASWLELVESFEEK
ncbi:MAG: ABC-F family ATP-binding cassette domain-containing protein [Solirubrobacteraceae bacterium]